MAAGPDSVVFDSTAGAPPSDPSAEVLTRGGPGEREGGGERVGLFWKLLLSYVALSLTVIIVLTLLLASVHRRFLQQQLDQRLRGAAISLATQYAENWPGTVNEELQQRAMTLGERTQLRLTFVAMDGKVLADSRKSTTAEVAEMERHQHREEIVEAIRSGVGNATRRSSTLGEPFRYCAVLVGPDDAPVGLVRTALPETDVTAEITRGQPWIWGISALVCLAAVAANYWLAARVADPLRAFQPAVEAIASGNYEYRVRIQPLAYRELNELAETFNNLCKKLAKREKQLRRTSQTQATVLEGMTESVIAIDRDEHILFANESAGKTLGFRNDLVQGRSLLEVVRNNDLRETAREALRGGRLSRRELEWRGASSHAFDVLATPLPGDPCPGVVLVLHDVTELKRLEGIRQEFVANVSHELKTPLSSIKAFTETLINGAVQDAEHSERFLTRIDEQADRLHLLIMDMLALARIESGQAALDISEVSLGRVVETCVAHHEAQATAANITLSNEAIDCGFMVRADEEGLLQVLGNLVDNAIKYTPSGGEVRVGCLDHEPTVDRRVAQRDVCRGRLR
ncbi:MAG: histidine kinase dimerization/phospho-acceptor domain-containing protein, partial [Planctomycetota bacterium]